MPDPRRKSYGISYGGGGPPQQTPKKPAPKPQGGSNIPGGGEIITTPSGNEFLYFPPQPTQTTPVIPDFVENIAKKGAALQQKQGKQGLEFGALGLGALKELSELDSPYADQDVQDAFAGVLASNDALAEQLGAPRVDQAIQSLARASRGQFGPNTEQTRQLLAQTAQGGGSETAFNRAFQTAVRDIAPGISDQFALSGATGSGLEKVAQTRATSDAFARLFNQREQRRLQAATALADFTGRNLDRQLQSAQQLPGVVAGRQQAITGARQKNLGLQLQRAQEPANRLSQITQLGRTGQVSGGLGVPLGAFAGSSTTGGSPNVINIGGGSQISGGGGGNPLLAGLGGAATGAQVGDLLGNPAVGAGIGGLIGLGAGGFF